MKETKIFSFDDLDFAANGERTEIGDDGRAVILSLDGERVELDLTAAHIKELREQLAPYFAAGQPPPPPPPPAKPLGKPPTDYNAGMRAYADARGLSYRTPGGGIYYPAQLRAEYDDYLAGGGK